MNIEKPDKKEARLHKIYQEKFGTSDLKIERGFQLNSTDYQLRLAALSLEKIQREIAEKPSAVIVRIVANGSPLTIEHYGTLTKEEIIRKYERKGDRG